MRALQPAAGNRYAVLEFTNASAHPCRTQGYPGLQLVDQFGHALPTTVVRDTSGTPQSLTLAPGSRAWARLHWSAVAGTGDSSTGSCQPPATAVRVIAPDEVTSSTATWSLGPVCSRGRIDVLPLAAGSGPAY